MDHEIPLPSTLRRRQNAARPSTASDTNKDRSKLHSSGKAVTKKSGIAQGDRGSTKTKSNHRKRGRIRADKERKEDDGSLRCLVTTTVILSILIVGGFILLIYLILEDPKIQNHFPYLHEYVSNNESFLSLWPYSIGTEEMADNGSTDASEEEDNQQRANLTPLSPSPIYTIPNSMPHIGDKSDEYARLRKEWDERYPPNSPERSIRAVEKLRTSDNALSSIYNRMRPPPLSPTSGTQDTERTTPEFDKDKDWNYDIYDCPDYPPPGYPREYKTIDILKHWPPTQNLPMGKYCNHYQNDTLDRREGDDTTDPSCVGDTNIPVMAHLGLCVFDYKRDYEKAMRYRSKEVPFVVRNDPAVAETVERWNDESYRRKLFGNLHHSDSDEIIEQNENGYNAAQLNDLNNITCSVSHRAEQSITNQVLFRHTRKKKKLNNSFVHSYSKKTPKMDDESRNEESSPPMPPPTKLVSMTYDRWYELAMEKENNSLIEDETGIEYYDVNLSGNKSSYYYYFRLVGCGEKDGCERNATEYLFDEMPFFQPRGSNKRTRSKKSQKSGTIESLSSDSTTKSLYLVEVEKQRGIHCRFGMPGMIAANHYDASRNAIAVLGGSRRYIVSRPNQCPNLGLYPTGHESARHSRVDWTTALNDYKKLEQSEGLLAQSDDPSWVEYRKSLSNLVNNATSTEVVLQAGDVLYLPSYWFHYIISLTTNMQCNTRSGHDSKDDPIMAKCGFPPPPDKKHHERQKHRKSVKD